MMDHQSDEDTNSEPSILENAGSSDDYEPSKSELSDSSGKFNTFINTYYYLANNIINTIPCCSWKVNTGRPTQVISLNKL